MRLARTLVAGLRRLARSQKGAAAVEFALIMPIMLTVYIGSIEASTLIIIDRKVQSVAGAVGDLVARSDKEILTKDLKDYFRAASGIMTPYSSQDVRQVVTAVKVASNGTTSVLWQSKFERGTYTAVRTTALPRTYRLPDEMIAISKGQMVIAAEASYSYTPLYGIVIGQEIDLYRSNFFMTRFEDEIKLVP
ncbi:TadE/TadG family type IV pilus assembly protein [Devosia rhizoryzae]|nr:TadE/TadG family type IV pilus assembly protein [Devosia rhizoryzae]